MTELEIKLNSLISKAENTTDLEEQNKTLWEAIEVMKKINKMKQSGHDKQSCLNSRSVGLR